MIERVVFRRPEWATVLGSALVLIGLALFMVVFVTLFPVLRDPVGAYDRWFPVDDAPNAVIAADDTPVRNEPIARFTWEAVAVESAVPPIYRVRFQSNAEPGRSDIVAWNWAFGDGSQSSGESVTHDYAEYGAYIVSLTVADADGGANTLAGEVIVPGIETTSGTIGQVDQLLSLDIEASIEDAVGSVGDDINATIDSAFGSIGKTVRGAVVVFLFALAAFATTMVAWRVARVGVMVLTRRPGAPRSDLQPPPAFDDDASNGNRQLELV